MRYNYLRGKTYQYFHRRLAYRNWNTLNLKVLFVNDSYSARVENATGEIPAGPLNAFCVEEKAASIPHSSVRKGTPPNDTTVPIIRRVSYLKGYFH